ncbi:MAG TPA: fluoride efflux transporter CrcB [Nocardioidaceae bacterium]|nr:fluoride efflux transporter CrcB [Nocardioidaceae bacterium]
MSALLWVALGSALGAPTRYVLDQLVQSRHERAFPWGTFTVNVTGSFALGVLVALASRQSVESWLVAAVGFGFLGSYTTFSTFTWETMRLVEEGAGLAACLNVVASIGAGAGAAAGGLLLGTALG